MDAITAKSAASRASIAISMMREGRTSSRSFDNCFEMGDGDEVVHIILERAKADDALLARCRKVFSRDTVARLGGSL